MPAYRCIHSIAILSLLLVAHLPAIAEPASDRPPAATTAPKLFGRIENGRYHAPGDVFSLPVPTMRGPEATVMDNGEIVVFKDRVSALLTIAAFPMPAIARWEHEASGNEKYLVEFFRDNILRDYRHEFPETSIESLRFLPDIHGGAVLACTLMPGGSAFPPEPASGDSAPASQPVVAKRAQLMFVREHHIFVIATELAERVTRRSAYSLDTSAEDSILLDRLLAVLDTLRFREPQPTELAKPTPQSPALSSQ
jgi:hypothetical protein